MDRKDRRTIAITTVTFEALHSVAKYRETMDDIVLKAIIVYAKALNINNDQIICANAEAKSRYYNE